MSFDSASLITSFTVLTFDWNSKSEKRHWTSDTPSLSYKKGLCVTSSHTQISQFISKMWSTTDLQNVLRKGLLLTYIIFSLLWCIAEISLLFSSYLELSIVSDVLITSKTSGLEFASLLMMLAFLLLKELSISWNSTMFDCKCSTWMFVLFSFVCCSFSLDV